MKQLCIISLFIISLYQAANAQSNLYVKGYYYTVELDTVYGYIKNDKNDNLFKNGILFREDLKSVESTSVSSNELAGFFIEPSREFQILKHNQSRILAQQITTGKLNLFYSKIDDQQVYLIIKDETTYLLENKKTSYVNSSGAVLSGGIPKYKGILNIVMQDAPEVFSKIPALSFTYKDILKLVNEYNNLFTNEYPNSNYRKPKIKAGLLINTHSIVNSTTVFFDTPFNNVPLSPSLTINGGIGVALYRHSKFNVLINLAYSSYESKLLNYQDLNSSKISNITMKYDFVETQVSTRYYFSQNTFRAFTQIGFSVGYLINSSIDNVFTFTPQGQEYEESFVVNARRFKGGIRPGIGVEYHSFGLLVEPYLDRSLRGPNSIIRRTGFSSSLYYRFR